MENFSEVVEIGLWICSGFLVVISGLLGWIATMLKSDKDIIETRLTKHDEEIHELALQSRETLTILKHKFKIK